MAIYRNSDYAMSFALTGKVKAPIVLPPTATIELVFAKSDSDIRLECTTQNGYVVLSDPNQGKFSLHMPAALTSTLVAGEYNVVCHRTDNQRTRLFTGWVMVVDPI